MSKAKKQTAADVATPVPTTSRWARPAASTVHGTGLYASEPIPKGTRVIEYVGDKITKAESDRREAARLARQEQGDDGCVYLFELNKRYDLDGDVEWNTARLINHSCEPNCETENANGHIWISALRDIAADEELSYDYGFDWENWRDHPCRCGSPKCFGYIVKRSQRKKVTKVIKAEAEAAKKARRKAKEKAKRKQAADAKPKGRKKKQDKKSDRPKREKKAGKKK
ncbi:SET domain-containing protein [Synoicihabitans lomoniglobus]|uniref:SET domain-containing protein-lysine N-methyltransferase n=1 Tax=Synoicihabitans lomoniglobus TaxID=2909285 RepID=A0AAF0CGX3_9BACT|nr:SET domain-containing protein-lysine N-methyltransferase [Opitutaceae bacterium LMO-M01]WED63797.1 SET domain-containing protein-lysine N-methyltransferase [Opitutaceae bacterium LMO-M01]